MRKQTTTITAIFLLLLLPLVAFSDAVKITVKGEKTYPLNRKIILKASFASDKAQYLWDVGSLSDDQYEKIGATIYLWLPEGKYTIGVTAVDFAAQKIDQTKYTFIVGSSPPDPPTPGPVDPPTPTPEDEFTKAVKSAFAEEVKGLTGKAREDVVDKVESLALVFKKAASTLTQDKKIKTAAALNSATHDVAKALLEDTDLPKLRKGVLLTYMKSNLPVNPNEALTDETRATFKTVYLKIANALENLK